MTADAEILRFFRERVAHARSRELAAFERWLAATDDYDVKLGAWFECRDVLSKAVAVLNDELVHRARLGGAA